jgi:hypothetical protein
MSFHVLIIFYRNKKDIAMKLTLCFIVLLIFYVILHIEAENNEQQRVTPRRARQFPNRISLLRRYQRINRSAKIVCNFIKNGFWQPVPGALRREVMTLMRRIYNLSDASIRKYCQQVLRRIRNDRPPVTIPQNRITTTRRITPITAATTSSTTTSRGTTNFIFPTTATTTSTLRPPFVPIIPSFPTFSTPSTIITTLSTSTIAVNNPTASTTQSPSASGSGSGKILKLLKKKNF